MKKEREEEGLVSWCFEPSQPQRVVSGLKQQGEEEKQKRKQLQQQVLINN